MDKLQLKRVDTQTYMILDKGFEWRPIYRNMFLGDWAIFDPIERSWSQGFETAEAAFEYQVNKCL